MKNIIISIGLMFGLVACHKNNLEEKDPKIIFGVSTAECLENCDTYYLLTSEKVFADDCDFCYYEEFEWQRKPMGDADFEIARPLLDSIPTALLDQDSKRYGCPGCMDLPTFYLQITKNGKTHSYTWGLISEVPPEIDPYFKQVEQVIEELRN